MGQVLKVCSDGFTSVAVASGCLWEETLNKTLKDILTRSSVIRRKKIYCSSKVTPLLSLDYKSWRSKDIKCKTIKNLCHRKGVLQPLLAYRCTTAFLVSKSAWDCRLVLVWERPLSGLTLQL